MRSRITYQVFQHIYLPPNFLDEFFGVKDRYSCPPSDIPEKKGQWGTLNNGGVGANNAPGPGVVDAPGDMDAPPPVAAVVGSGVRPVSPPPPVPAAAPVAPPPPRSPVAADAGQFSLVKVGKDSAERYTKVLGLSSPQKGTDSFRKALVALREHASLENIRCLKNEIATMDEIVRVTVALRKEDDPKCVWGYFVSSRFSFFF